MSFIKLCRLTSVVGAWVLHGFDFGRLQSVCSWHSRLTAFPAVEQQIPLGRPSWARNPDSGKWPKMSLPPGADADCGFLLTCVMMRQDRRSEPRDADACGRSSNTKVVAPFFEQTPPWSALGGAGRETLQLGSGSPDIRLAGWKFGSARSETSWGYKGSFSLQTVLRCVSTSRQLVSLLSSVSLCFRHESVIRTKPAYVCKLWQTRDFSGVYFLPLLLTLLW